MSFSFRAGGSMPAGAGSGSPHHRQDREERQAETTADVRERGRGTTATALHCTGRSGQRGRTHQEGWPRSPTQRLGLAGVRRPAGPAVAPRDDRQRRGGGAALGALDRGVRAGAGLGDLAGTFFVDRPVAPAGAAKMSFGAASTVCGDETSSVPLTLLPPGRVTASRPLAAGRRVVSGGTTPAPLRGPGRAAGARVPVGAGAVHPQHHAVGAGDDHQVATAEPGA